MSATGFIFLLIGIVIGILVGFFLRDRQASSSPVAQLPTANQLADAMDGISSRLHALDVSRAETSARLNQEMQHLTQTSLALAGKTDKLLTTLGGPGLRGQWGEMQLQRVVELSGMIKHCDFDTQVSTTSHSSRVRPDLVVHLAGGRDIVVDSKVPLSAYTDALEVNDSEEQAGYLRRHAYLMRQHVTQLSAKDYARGFAHTPEFVVMFIPADSFLDAALKCDSELLEFAFSRNIIIATPSTLMALLRTVALGWQSADVEAKAGEIHALGTQLYRRLATLNEHYAKLGSLLDKTVEQYNVMIGSMESRVAVTARRLAELELDGGTQGELPVIEHLERHPRHASGHSAENTWDI
ncbi:MULTISPECIES: DNA recombination protein RmuC [Corynebacterium]|uniref:DNA recombination protein RmuC n=2 Tax=Corynebacterium glucuronolyticum TaxID=39791 RepID=A0A7T4EES6_9CORY|nr:MULTISPECIES: DNA recombination protein RmuC [Corynebacterium]EEI62672.1 RmuC domain protein [Corynebacterium glucuronolyticum ATCC 51866]MCT1441774.1 DNA recombination protein RmuC [Corynebacterium glucuronolyticum]MCT1562456.1 DNA recombination protein RmuC [Corynebacterium glucuronolyticum]OFO42850.1 DNA recombinase [Corynebacterium sp. HMSC073D01]QQB46056.1 DNA recombination protein RmuC [Corynebacterium glucuronolyticum]